MHKQSQNIRFDTFFKAFVLGLLTYLLASCTSNKQNEEAPHSTSNAIHLSAEQIKNAGITLGTLEEHSIQEIVHANGVVDVPPQGLASVSVQMAGYLTENNVIPGQHVHKGEALATFRNATYIDLQQELVKETSKLTYVQQEHERTQELFNNKVAAEKDFQQIGADYVSQKALVKALEEKIKLLGLLPEEIRKGNISSTIQLKSPIQGYVKSATTSIGKYCLPETVLFEITDISHMHLELQIFEKDAMKIENGQKVLFTATGLGDKKMEGYVFVTGKSLDLSTRTVGLHVHFDEQKYKGLLPGMYVSAQILTNKHQTKTLPEAAIVKNGKQSYVFTTSAESGWFQKSEVSTGATSNGWTEIANAESLTGKKIVLVGAYYLQAEMLKPVD